MSLRTTGVTALLIVLSCLGHLSLRAQTNLDSLYTELQQHPTDTSGVTAMKALFNYYIAVDLDSCLKYARSVEQTSQRIQYDDGLCWGQFYMAVVYLNMGRQDSAGHYLALAQELGEATDNLVALSDIYGVQGAHFNRTGEFEKGREINKKALEVYRQLDDKVGILFVRGHMANVEMNVGNLPEALKIFLESIKLAEEYELAGEVPEIYREIGLIHDLMEDYPEAIRYNRLAIQRYRELGQGESKGIAFAYNQLGTIFHSQNQLDSARMYFELQLPIYEAYGSQRAVSGTLGNLASVLQSQVKLDSALIMEQKALQIAREYNITESLAQSLQSIASIQLDKGNLPAASAAIEEGLIVARQQGQVLLRKELTEVLVRVRKRQGRYQDALEAHEQYILLRDSFVNVEDKASIAEQEVRFELEKKATADSVKNAEAAKVAAAQLSAEKALSAQREQLLWLVGGLGSMALIIGILVFLRYRDTQRKNAIIEATNAELDQRNSEKEVLLKEIHHRVKNNLQIISSLLDLQSKGIEDEGALDAVSDGQSRVQSMALIHQKLYQTDGIAHVNFGDYAHQLFDQLSALYKATGEHQNKPVCTVAASDIELDIDTAIPVGLMLNELITNAFKYAFDSVDSGQLEISLKQLEPGSYEMQVRDNGPGLPTAFDFKKSRSLGLRLVKRLSRQLYGTAEYAFENGSVFSLRFSDTEARKAIA